MEELDHYDAYPRTSPPKEQKQNENTPAQGQPLSGAGGSSKRVATWARLLQDEENMGQIENSEIRDYSCIKLLRDMEALEQEEEEMQDMVQDDEELVTLP
jgi:hypothetical protein